MKNTIHNRSILIRHSPRHVKSRHKSQEILSLDTFRFLSTATLNDNPGKFTHEFRREGVR